MLFELTLPNIYENENLVYDLWESRTDSFEPDVCIVVAHCIWPHD